MNAGIDDASVLARKFKGVHRQLEYVKAKIYRQEGLWFFKSHVYTIEELMQSEHHKKIDALTRKIGDDATRWYRAGTLSEEGWSKYHREVDAVEERLHQLNLEIQAREPTLWENIKGAFTKFLEIVIVNLPPLTRNALEYLAERLKLPSPIKRILSLPYKRKQ